MLIFLNIYYIFCSLQVRKSSYEEQLRNDPQQKNNRGLTIWKEFCEREQCANFINASDFFFDEVERIGIDATINTYYIKNDTHFNKEGNWQLYKAIEKQLVQ